MSVLWSYLLKNAIAWLFLIEWNTSEWIFTCFCLLNFFNDIKPCVFDTNFLNSLILNDWYSLPFNFYSFILNSDFIDNKWLLKIDSLMIFWKFILWWYAISRNTTTVRARSFSWFWFWLRNMELLKSCLCACLMFIFQIVLIWWSILWSFY